MEAGYRAHLFQTVVRFPLLCPLAIVQDLVLDPCLPNTHIGVQALKLTLGMAFVEQKSVSEMSDMLLCPLRSDERDGLKESLDNSRVLLQEAKQKETDLSGQVNALHLQVQSLTTAKQEVRCVPF